MSGLYHQRHDKRLHRGKGGEQHLHRHKFERAAEDRQAHEQWIEKTETGYIHIDAVGDAQEPEAGKDRDGVRKGMAGGLPDPLTF